MPGRHSVLMLDGLSETKCGAGHGHEARLVVGRAAGRRFWRVAGPLWGDHIALDLGCCLAPKGQPPQLSSLGGEEMGCQTCRLWEVRKRLVGLHQLIPNPRAERMFFSRRGLPPLSSPRVRGLPTSCQTPPRA